MINIRLFKSPEDTEPETLSAEVGKNLPLPRPTVEGRSFLGWNIYSKLKYGFMNYIPDEDTDLYAITTDAPSYILESHFRSVPEDAADKRAHFRRYVVDVYLENGIVTSGSFGIENCNHIFYYLGYIPVDGVDVKITADTNMRGHAYHNVAYFTTSDITVEWSSESPLDATAERKKLCTIMLAFGKWGMKYREVESRTSDEILIPSYIYEASADGREAYVSANFYGGVIPEEPMEPCVVPTYITESDLPDLGERLARFAVMSDSHIGSSRYWPSYDRLLGIFKHLEMLHTADALDFVLELGDSIDDGYAKSYQPHYTEYLEKIKSLTICDPENPIEGRRDGTIPHYELQGNHDTSLDTRFFRQRLWFTENKSGQKVAFIGFFTNYGGYPAVHVNVAGNYSSYKSYGILKDETVAFVEESIRNAVEAGAAHIVLCNHFGIAQDLAAPVLPESGLGKITNLCERYGIRLYLNGHEHNVNYPIRKYKNLYNYDASKTGDKYAIFEIFEKYVKTTIYNSADNSIARIDLIEIK